MRTHHILRFAGLLLVLVIANGCATHPKPPRGTRPVDKTMSMSAYCACGQCCNWKRNWLFKPVVASGPSKGKPKKVGITASGLKARRGTIAADTDYYPFGTVMYIPGYGYGRVEDRGKAIKGPGKLDLFFPKHRQALEWGRRKGTVRVWKP
jgi:3D (Asp-Asp-Asp) domain-containing protein